MLILPVTCSVFIVACNAFLCGVIIRFFRKKPPLSQTAMDLLDVDFFRLYSLSLCLNCAAVAARSAADLPAPVWLALAMGWTIQFCMQVRNRESLEN